jgi:aspartyl-tRNA(Asn)/glutamyl-tRNA(Gln) amidotransferase subunit A
MYRTIGQVKEALHSGVTVLEITQNYLELIDKSKHLNAFLEVFTDSVLAEARRVDEKIANGTAGKLAGVVVGIKDNICYRNHLVSAASKILEGFESLFTATALQRLIAEDAIIIGRLNCDEFAMGSSNENSAFGSVENNWKANYVPGGSSGGSAVAVSAGLCTVSLGSDTGGSVRQPASWTGTYGLKPTYGRISRYGLIAYASSFDQIGTFTNCIEDAEILLSIMAGKDEFDSTSSSYPLNENKIIPTNIRVGIIKECIEHEGLDPEVKKSLLNKIESLKSAGHEVIELSFPYLDYIVPAYYVLTTAEASSNLARFDGVHFGYRSPKAEGVDQTYVKSRSEGFGNEVKRRIMAGTFVLSHGYYDAYYTKAQKVRRLLKNKTDEIFGLVDFLLMPITSSTAFEKNSIKDTIQMYLQDIFTVHANLTGNPAFSIPLGIHSNGLPFGIQLMTDRFKENELFEYAKVIEDI